MRAIDPLWNLGLAQASIVHSTAASVDLDLQNSFIPFRKKAELVLGASTSKGLAVYTATPVSPKPTDVDFQIQTYGIAETAMRA